MKTHYEQIQRMLAKIISHFGSINKRTDLTDKDKAALKQYYLEHFVTPRARKLIEKKFPGAVLLIFPPERCTGRALACGSGADDVRRADERARAANARVLWRSSRGAPGETDWVGRINLRRSNISAGPSAAASNLRFGPAAGRDAGFFLPPLGFCPNLSIRPKVFLRSYITPNFGTKEPSCPTA